MMAKRQAGCAKLQALPLATTQSPTPAKGAEPAAGERYREPCASNTTLTE